jgi:ubiquinone/menaquinone biosynthesis C-methylase UbiE/uncharacterized membrane protein YbhN (UPF0104 family)
MFLYYMAALFPAFIFSRIFKWFLLVRQIDEQVSFKDMIPDYLWGMAIGMVTPGRVGELVRVRHLNISKKRALVFFLLEKFIEVTVLAFLCLIAFISLGFIGFWVLPIVIACALLVYLFVQKLGRFPARIEELKCAIFQLRIVGCLFVSFLCFTIFCVQAYLVLKSMDKTVSLDVIILYPVVLIGNLIPISVGGFGVRETFAIIILQQRNVASEAAMSSISIVALLDLAVPALIGLFMNLKQQNAGLENKEINKITDNEKLKDWDIFWQNRREKGLGRFISWVRHNFVTSAMIKYILNNTQKGTLVEAGCGEGEVTLSVSKIRDDKVVLVDKSNQALAIARQKALELGVEASFINCDIEQTSDHVAPSEDSVVYNIGVIEHFEDCTYILREMDKASGRYALALIPEKSIFWSTYIALSFKLGMVPSEFYVHLFDEAELRQVVKKAEMEILWVRRLRVLGLIPYIGICFRSPPKSLN